MSNLTEVVVPDIGDFDSVEVIELLVKVGDQVKPEQSLITVESDKASMEIPSSHAGVVKSLAVKLGDKIKKGSVILQLDVAAASTSITPANAASQHADMTAASAIVRIDCYPSGAHAGSSWILIILSHTYRFCGRFELISSSVSTRLEPASSHGEPCASGIDCFPTACFTFSAQVRPRTGG